MVVIAVDIMLWGAGFAWFMQKVPNYPIQHIPESFNTLIILTGGSDRIEQGMALAKRHGVEQVFISGVGDGVSQQDLIEKNTDIPVFLGHKARDTIGNIQEILEWTEERSIKSYIIVTAYYHIPRVKLEFEKAHKSIHSATVNSIYYPIYPQVAPRDRWWKSPISLYLLLSEYHKYLYRLWV